MTLLRHHVQNLELDADAPYRNRTLKEQLEAWRNEQRRIHRPVHPNGVRDTYVAADYPAEYGEEQ